MKKAIILVLIYFVMQILGALTVAPLALLCTYLATGTVDVGLGPKIVVPVMLLGFLYMAAYLWKKGYLADDGRAYHPTTPRCIACAILSGLAAIFLTSVVMSVLSFLPDWTQANFAALQGTWMGIASIVVLGPILEELLFRKAVHQELMKHYGPAGVVVLSGLLFGLSHLNPAQVVGGCLMGFLLAWMYWQTGSLMPGLVVHVLNNGLSTWLSIEHPEVEELADLLPGASLWVGTLAALLLLALTIWGIRKASPARA